MAFILVELAILAVLAVMHKRVTIPAGLAVLCITSGVLLGIMSFLGVNLLFGISFALFIAGWVAFKIKFNSLDFSKRIFSLGPDLGKGKNGSRVIGKCFPYYKKQLKYNNSTIALSDTITRGGMIVTGSSGSGKTYSIINLIKQDISQGKSVVFIDFKGDLNTLDTIEKAASGVRVCRMSWDMCNFTYDPLENLDDNGRVEAILNMRKWSIDGTDAHYKTGVQLFLQKALRDYKHTTENFLLGFYSFLKTYNVEKQHYESYITTMKLLELTITSNAGHEMLAGSGEKFSFNDGEQFVLLVAFTSSSKSLGTSITSLMLKDLMEVGVRRAYSPELCLYIDEFGSCESPIIVKDILEKGRSCGIATVLSMQDLNQLIISTSAPFMDSVLGTVNTFIVFNGATKQTAEKLAGVQIWEIEDLLMSLRKPTEDGKPPTAMLISKYPIFNKGGTEVYRFIPSEAPEGDGQAHRQVLQVSQNPTKENVENEQANGILIEEVDEEDSDEYSQELPPPINYDYFL